MPTQADFLKAYEAHLASTYAWARDAGKLAVFMIAVQRTLQGANSWNHTGDAVTAAWRDIGGKGVPSRRALRALPIA